MFREWLFLDSRVVFCFPADPDIVITTINIDFLTLAISELFLGIPKNLSATMSTFVVGFFFSFRVYFLWHFVLYYQISIKSVIRISILQLKTKKAHSGSFCGTHTSHPPPIMDYL